jgi:PAS domain S-box-containing protein
VAPVGIGTVRDRVVVEVNQRICDMTGYAASELVGQSARILYLSDGDFDYVGREKYRQIAERGVGEVETRWRRKDGTLIDVLLASTPLDPSSGTKDVTFTALDITARKQAEQERLRWQAQRQQAQKLESLGVLAGGIAHDFNNILTGLLVNADIALSELADDSPLRDLLLDVQAAGRRAADLTAQMLAYSGRGAFTLEEIDISALLKSMASQLMSAASKGSSLLFDLASGLPTVLADANQLRQVAVNLVTNASDALGGVGGQVTVRTYLADCDGTLLANACVGSDLDAGRYVTVEITDTGCGIDEESKGRIFDPFFTTKATGRGLGLAAVQGIVRGHKGAVMLTSMQGKGTTFKVLLPVSGPPRAPKPARPSEQGGWRGTGTVLVVDDEEMLLRATTRMLGRLGFTVITASDGVNAVKLFRERQQEIACVLLDVVMPRMGGEETFEKLRQIRPDVLVIMTSGFSEQESTKLLGAKGLAGFIEKPYEPASLAEKLREVLGSR